MRKGLVRRHSGQSMVEFAVLAPVFFMLLLGTIDLGRAVYIYNSISDAAREGARAAIPRQDLGKVRISQVREPGCHSLRRCGGSQAAQRVVAHGVGGELVQVRTIDQLCGV